jgi:hypothetical protein
MKSPYKVVLYTSRGFLSPVTVELQINYSVILPTVNEFAQNCINIPILGYRTTVSGTTAKITFFKSSSSFFSLSFCSDIIDKSFLAVPSSFFSSSFLSSFLPHLSPGLFYQVQTIF